MTEGRPIKGCGCMADIPYCATGQLLFEKRVETLTAWAYSIGTIREKELKKRYDEAQQKYSEHAEIARKQYISAHKKRLYVLTFLAKKNLGTATTTEVMTCTRVASSLDEAEEWGREELNGRYPLASGWMHRFVVWFSHSKEGVEAILEEIEEE